MDGVHLCHDVQIGNHCVLGIKTTVAGECQIDDCTILSSNVILHQYCHIGSWVLIQAGCRISKDVPPYIIMNGNPAEYHGINAAVPHPLRRLKQTPGDRTCIAPYRKCLPSGIPGKLQRAGCLAED